jgi:hypothetical protein
MSMQLRTAQVIHKIYRNFNIETSYSHPFVVQ